MTTDVIVVTWQSGDRVVGCLERLEPQVEHVTWVVDNASSDGTPERVRRTFAEARLLVLERNVGFGAAVNAAARRGNGEAIVLVNDDVELQPGALGALVAPLRRPQVGMVAGMTLIPRTGAVDGFGIEIDSTLAAYNRFRRRSPHGSPGRLLGPSGGLAAYRRTAFERAGGFDERFFAYGEDVDLALRLRLAGWEAAEARDARGVHLGGATVGVDSPRQRYLAGFARGFLLRRFGVLRTRHAARALLIEALVVTAGLFRGRTLAHVRGRLEGWRAARADRLPVPVGAVDASISAREAMRRLRHAR